MKRKFLVLAACSIGFFTACSDDSANNNTNDNISIPSEEHATESVPLMPVETTEGTTTPEAQPVAPSGGANSGGASAGLNPPHGQPGHRCEIPVGAPLDGSPAPAAGPSLNSSPVTIPGSGSSNQAPVSSSSGKVNPPHGQPGHDCAVPVGAPLP